MALEENRNVIVSLLDDNHSYADINRILRLQGFNHGISVRTIRRFVQDNGLQKNTSNEDLVTHTRRAIQQVLFFSSKYTAGQQIHKYIIMHTPIRTRA